MSIYFDHAATTRVTDKAAQSAITVMVTDYGNPSSRHEFGSKIARKISEERGIIAASIGALPEELFFTSCGTEGNNWAIFAAEKIGKRRGKHIITTSVEHSAVLEPIKKLEQDGFDVTYLQPDQSGHISLEQVENALRNDTILISMMLVNNETGAIFPVDGLAKLVKEKQSPTLIHCDAVQAFCKVPFNIQELGVDFLTLSAHKIGGLKGTGALFVKKGLKIPPFLLGGGQEHGLRSGTESTPQIAAFATAVSENMSAMDGHIQHMREIKSYALKELSKKIKPFSVVSEGDAPHVCAISLHGYPSEMIVRDLSDREIYVSSGSACHKGKPSHVFAAMKLKPLVQMGVLRLSFSHENTFEEADVLVSALEEIVKTRIPSKR